MLLKPESYYSASDSSVDDNRVLLTETESSLEISLTFSSSLSDSFNASTKDRKIFGVSRIRFSFFFGGLVLICLWLLAGVSSLEKSKIIVECSLASTVSSCKSGTPLLTVPLTGGLIGLIVLLLAVKLVGDVLAI